MVDHNRIRSSDEPIFIASSDGHVGIETKGYGAYLEDQYQPAFAEFLATHKYRWTPERPESVFKPALRGRHRAAPGLEELVQAVLRDPHHRVRALDGDGVAVEVLFPDDQNLNTPPWLAGIAPHGLDARYPDELRLAGARAYNRWLAEFCSAAPERLLGVTALGSLADVDSAVAEVRRAAASGLTAGIVLPCDYYLPLYHHERYDDLWRVCEELDLVVVVHTGDGGPSWYGEGQRASAVYMAEVFFYSHRPLWCLIFGGVFDRFPRLKVAFTEQGCGWVPETLRMLDGIASSAFFRWTDEEPLAMRPSEYFAKHCFVGHSTMTRSDVEQFDVEPIPNVMWGTDFPHFESTWPDTRPRLRELLKDMPEGWARALLGGEFARAYGVDLAAMRPLVERIGPRPSEFPLSV
jgi:predicted TIM-barrel fold metal-dependent hydrolase